MLARQTTIGSAVIVLRINHSSVIGYCSDTTFLRRNHPVHTMTSKTYIVEHLDDELGPWSELEYITIARESNEAGASFCLSSVPPSLSLPDALKSVPGFKADGKSVEVLYEQDKSRVCLLDPSATKELSPEDGDTFDVFLFGGVLGSYSFLPVLEFDRLTSVR